MNSDQAKGLGCIVVIVGGIMMLNGLGRLDQWFGLPLCFAAAVVFWYGWVVGTGS